VAVDFTLPKVDVRHSDVCKIARLQTLERLGLRGREVSDSTLEVVLQMKGLETLTLRKTSVTDRGMAVLTRARNLRHLSVNSPFVTNESIDFLEEMEHLESLYLRDTSITQEGVLRLQQRLRKTDVTSSVPIDVVQLVSSRMGKLRSGMSKREIWDALEFDPDAYVVAHVGGGGSLAAIRSIYMLRDDTLLTLLYDLRNAERRWVFSRAELTTRK
jgi:hypothetical protein